MALAAGELEEYAALEAIGSLGAASTYSEGGAAVPNAVASAVAADSANGWKVLGAMGALVSCLPLGSASLEVGGGYRSVCLFVCLFVRAILWFWWCLLFACVLWACLLSFAGMDSIALFACI